MIGEDVLDAHCGSGEVAARLAGDGYRVVATDAAKANVDATLKLLKARELAVGERLSVIQAPLTDLPSEAAAIDTVVLHGALAQLTDPAPALREAARVLRPGGRVVITCPYGSGAGKVMLGDLIEIASMYFSVRDAVLLGDDVGVIGDRMTPPELPDEVLTRALAVAERRVQELEAGAASELEQRTRMLGDLATAQEKATALAAAESRLQTSEQELAQAREAAKAERFAAAAEVERVTATAAAQHDVFREQLAAVKQASEEQRASLEAALSRAAEQAARKDAEHESERVGAAAAFAEVRETLEEALDGVTKARDHDRETLSVELDRARAEIAALQAGALAESEHAQAEAERLSAEAAEYRKAGNVQIARLTKEAALHREALEAQLEQARAAAREEQERLVLAAREDRGRADLAGREERERLEAAAVEERERAEVAARAERRRLEGELEQVVNDAQTERHSLQERLAKAEQAAEQRLAAQKAELEARLAATASEAAVARTEAEARLQGERDRSGEERLLLLEQFALERAQLEGQVREAGALRVRADQATAAEERANALAEQVAAQERAIAELTASGEASAAGAASARTRNEGLEELLSRTEDALVSQRQTSTRELQQAQLAWDQRLVDTTALVAELTARGETTQERLETAQRRVSEMRGEIRELQKALGDASASLAAQVPLHEEARERYQRLEAEHAELRTLADAAQQEASKERQRLERANEQLRQQSEREHEQLRGQTDGVRQERDAARADHAAAVDEITRLEALGETLDAERRELAKSLERLREQSGRTEQRLATLESSRSMRAIRRMWRIRRGLTPGRGDRKQLPSKTD